MLENLSMPIKWYDIRWTLNEAIKQAILNYSFVLKQSNNTILIVEQQLVQKFLVKQCIVK